MESKTELQKSAIAESRTRDLETYQRALDVQWLNNRMEDDRVSRCLTSIHNEAEMENDSKERAEHAAAVTAEKEAALAIETAIVQDEKDYEQRSRLINRLEAGFVYRGLDEQKLHNECSRMQEKVQEQHDNYLLREAVLKAKDALELQEAEKDKLGQCCRELQQQLMDRQQQIQCQYGETRIEKKKMEDIMRAISDQDKREIQDKRDQTKKSHCETVTSQQAPEDWCCQQKQLLVSEERRAKEQRAVADDRSAAMRTERKQEQRDISEANHKVVKQHIADEATRHERDITRQRQDQEYREKNVQHEISEKKKFEQMKSDTNQSFNTHMDNKNRMGEEQKTRDAEHKKQNDALIAIDDEIDIEEEQQKKAQNHLYSLDLLEQINDNRKRKQDEKEMDEEFDESAWEWNKSWSKEGAEERKKRACSRKKKVRSGAYRHEDY